MPALLILESLTGKSPLDYLKDGKEDGKEDAKEDGNEDGKEDAKGDGKEDSKKDGKSIFTALNPFTKKKARKSTEQGHGKSIEDGHGKSIEEGHGKSTEQDIVTWVNSIGKEEWTKKVFDRSMKWTKNNEIEMIDLMEIGLHCCESDIMRRWDMRKVSEKIQLLRETENEEDYLSDSSE